MKSILKNLIKPNALSKALIIIGLIFYNPVSSQLDRSVMPESGPAPEIFFGKPNTCLLYTSPSPRDKRQSRMPSSA